MASSLLFSLLFFFLNEAGGERLFLPSRNNTSPNEASEWILRIICCSHDGVAASPFSLSLSLASTIHLSSVPIFSFFFFFPCIFIRIISLKTDLLFTLRYCPRHHLGRNMQHQTPSQHCAAAIKSLKPNGILLFNNASPCILFYWP